MISRDILNYLGQKIGTMEFPDGTQEDVIAKKLAVYATPPPLPPVPPNVTPRQIRQALVLSGVSMEIIDAAIDSLPEPHKILARIEWEYSTAFIRANPLVAQIGQVLGWSSEQIDELWKLAGSL